MAPLTDETQINHLHHLEEILKEQKNRVQVFTPSDLVPMPVLGHIYAVDNLNRERSAIYHFIPLDEEEAENTLYLQFMSEMPYPVLEQQKEDILNLLNELNQIMPLGMYFLQENKIFYRYMFVSSSAYLIPKEVFLEAVDMFVNSLEVADDVLEMVAGGETDWQNGLAIIRSEMD